jgi:thioredoxin reductase/ferredoxin
MRIPLLSAYTHWLHTRWPAGLVERMPKVNEDGSTDQPGVYVAGDLSGVPLLKFSADSGARIVQQIAQKPREPASDGAYDLIILGAGVAGVSAAIEARKAGLKYLLLDAAERFSTVINFPKAKPIYTYPKGMQNAGELHFREEIHPKEVLIDDLNDQAKGIEVTHARATRIEQTRNGLTVHLDSSFSPHPSSLLTRSVLIAIGRSGNYRKLDVPGEEKTKVMNRLHDPADYAGQHALVVGGGDSALETAIALAKANAHVTLSYRKPDFARPKPDNIEQIESLKDRITLKLETTVKQIEDDSVELVYRDGQSERIRNDVVFTMIGREPPLEFFRKSGLPIQNERNTRWWVTLVLFLAFCIWMYHWKKGGVHITGIERVDAWLDVGSWWSAKGWFPYNVGTWFGDATSSIASVLKVSLSEAGFYYSLAYCACVVGFGIDRMKRRRTPYVKVQTITLMLVQCIPLFLLPYLVLPLLGRWGAFDAGILKSVADEFFPAVNYGHGREYWRAFGFILAWPLFIWNVFTSTPMWGWLIVSLVQTFVIIPAIVYFWGKGAYCGWICSCGALAETLGDRHRQKMPHGPFWNRFNMVGQVFLTFAMVLLALRVIGWVFPGSFAGRAFEYLLHDLPILNYVWFVDLVWAGILGVGLYFWFSGRFWCRFACPLAALMHIYHRFGRFAILAEKKKCISCNVCTSVCHQGIDVMSFANKGKPMLDPECVRCSACVQMCPTGVLSFGQVDRQGVEIRKDPEWLMASPVQRAELTVKGKRI